MHLVVHPSKKAQVLQSLKRIAEAKAEALQKEN